MCKREVCESVSTYLLPLKDTINYLDSVSIDLPKLEESLQVDVQENLLLQLDWNSVQVSKASRRLGQFMTAIVKRAVFDEGLGVDGIFTKEILGVIRGIRAVSLVGDGVV
jgi:hypothetical protein